MFNGNGKQNTKSQCDGPLYEPLEADEDLLTEDIVRSVKKTPVGQLLQKISTMPEVRQDKVLRGGSKEGSRRTWRGALLLSNQGVH